MAPEHGSIDICKLSTDILLLQIPLEPNEEWIAKIESRYPGLEVRWIPLRWSPGSKDMEHDIAPQKWKGVTIACLFPPHPAHLMSQVRYVQLTSASADKWYGHEVYKNRDVAFCTANGAQPPQIAEWVMGTWLMTSHGFLNYIAFQKDAKWCNQLSDIQDSSGLRMGILGYGAVGRQCARLAAAMGMEVYAFTRSPRVTAEDRKDDSYCIPGMGDPDGLIPTRWFHGTSKAAVNDFLGHGLDILVISLPLTKSTEFIIDREQLDILAKSKRKTFLSNVARGKHVNPDALLEALQRGKIRGAALDVTYPEPLPDGHPLFTAPNIIITPHVSWRSPRYWDRILAIVEANLERLNSGEKLLNLVDKEHDY
ncbi:hypothetical protein GQ53DRAFT_882823 [Thozetella sp. PMI_491]|nr:hypothetical protein GQ53DRAFT_882823 [Thozetella sp. PMI_491]